MTKLTNLGSLEGGAPGGTYCLISRKCTMRYGAEPLYGRIAKIETMVARINFDIIRQGGGAALSDLAKALHFIEHERHRRLQPQLLCNVSTASGILHSGVASRWKTKLRSSILA